MSETRIFPKGDIFHICNKSIANYQIFRFDKSISRFISTINYYNSISRLISLSRAARKPLDLPHIMSRDKDRIFALLAYCIMPNHYHLLVKMQSDYSFSKYMNNIENSYTRYFNKCNRRKGPLWQSQFRSIHVKADETLLHVHRYIHLNPTTANLVKNPLQWEWSSYKYFLNNSKAFLDHKELSIDTSKRYKKFVEDHIDYQRKMKTIQKSFLD